MIRNLKQYCEGTLNYSPFYKSSLPNAGARRYVDLSMGAGTPKFNAYVGGQYEATVLTGSGNAGIYVGSGDRYVNRLTVNTTTANSIPCHLMLCDYLMFYPLIDLDSTDLQELDNTATLTRYTDGVNVQVMAVVTTPMAASVNCNVNYTNALGVDVTTSFTLISNANIGGIISSASTQSTATTANSPFLPIKDGCRKINSIQLVGSAGGFASFVLVKPLIQLALLELGVPNELEPVRQMGQMKKIYNGAYLNFVALQGGSAGATGIQGILETMKVEE